MSELKPPGVFDILPVSPKEEWRSSHIWEYVEKIIRQTAHEYGYQEIRTPIFERTELFTRGDCREYTQDQRFQRLVQEMTGRSLHSQTDDAVCSALPGCAHSGTSVQCRRVCVQAIDYEGRSR